MTRLPVLHQRPRTLADCKFFGAPAPTKSADTRAFDEVAELDVDDVDEDDADRDELDEQLDAAAERAAEQRREEGGVPCPFVGCAEHLAWLAIGILKPLELSEGELRAAIPKLEALDLDTLPATCAQRGPFTLEDIGRFFDVSRERIRQIEAKALRRLRHPERVEPLRAFRAEGVEHSRPDLVDERTSIGLHSQVAAAAKRIVPAIAAESLAASARAKPGERNAMADTRRCATDGCGNERSRWTRDVAADLLPLCGQCRNASRRARGIPAKRRFVPLVTARGESLSLQQWADRLGYTRTALSTNADRNGRSYAEEVERRLAERDAEVPAPAPVPDPPAPAAEHLHDVDVTTLEPSELPSMPNDTRADASASPAREAHVQSDPTTIDRARTRAPADARKRSRKPNAKPAPKPKRAQLSVADQLVRNAQRGFAAIASRVGKGRV